MCLAGVLCRECSTRYESENDMRKRVSTVWNCNTLLSPAIHGKEDDENENMESILHVVTHA